MNVRCQKYLTHWRGLHTILTHKYFSHMGEGAQIFLHTRGGGQYRHTLMILILKKAMDDKVREMFLSNDLLKIFDCAPVCYLSQVNASFLENSIVDLQGVKSICQIIKTSIIQSFPV